MIKVGLIGCGGIGTVHVERLRQIEEIKVTAAVDIIPERAEKVASLAGCQAFSDYTDALDRVDAVWVCTPPDTHEKISVTCLQAGKDVFCEKPMALSLEAADNMISAAKKSGKLLAIGYCLRFSPWGQLCREIVQKGELGEVTMAWIARMSEMPPTGWLGQQERSGGMLTEQTTHNLDWLRFTVGEVAEVMGLSKTVLPGVNIRDNVVGLLRFTNGAIGQIMASWSSATSWIESGIVGTRGVLRTGQGGTITVHLSGSRPRTYQPDERDMYLEEDKAFINAVLNKEAWPLDPVEARKTLALSLGILQAAETGQSVSF